MMLHPGGVKIWRPRQVHKIILFLRIFLIETTQIYVGEGKRDYVPVDKRVAVNGDK
jgi:citrate synthase